MHNRTQVPQTVRNCMNHVGWVNTCDIGNQDMKHLTLGKI